VLEHTPNTGLVLKEIHRILKDNGEFIVSVPNGELKTRMYLLLKKLHKLPLVKKLDKQPAALGGHIHMFNIGHLKLLMKTYNFVVDEYIGRNASDEYIIMRCRKK
jgi:2-polyprenyl-3-methyl-5-hydroxy-6-metoxy-1,4-benzoquinol methylase